MGMRGNIILSYHDQSCETGYIYDLKLGLRKMLFRSGMFWMGDCVSSQSPISMWQPLVVNRFRQTMDGVLRENGG